MKFMDGWMNSIHYGRGNFIVHRLVDRNGSEVTLIILLDLQINEKINSFFQRWFEVGTRGNLLLLAVFPLSSLVDTECQVYRCPGYVLSRWRPDRGSMLRGKPEHHESERICSRSSVCLPHPGNYILVGWVCVALQNQKGKFFSTTTHKVVRNTCHYLLVICGRENK